MSLSQSKLKTELVTALQTNPANMTLFAEVFSTAYDNYAKDAVDISGESLATTGKNAMKSSLLSLDAPGNVLPLYALAIETAVIAYWGASAFPKLIPPTGISSETSVTITPMTPGSIQPGLLAKLLLGAGDVATSADDHSIILHTATITVKTTHTGPSTAFPFPVIVIGPSPIS